MKLIQLKIKEAFREGKMKKTDLPKVELKELTLNDIEDCFQWSLDKEVIKHLNMPEKNSSLTREETVG